MSKGKFSLEVLKYNALKLRANYQIPYKLAYYINQITKNTPESLVKYLMTETEHLLRVKGYYKKYPKIERETNAIIEHDYLKLLESRV